MLVFIRLRICMHAERNALCTILLPCGMIWDALGGNSAQLEGCGADSGGGARVARTAILAVQSLFDGLIVVLGRAARDGQTRNIFDKGDDA